MTTPELLEAFSEALAERAAAVQGALVAIRAPRSPHLTGVLWQPDVAVASEQSLPRCDEYELVVAGREVVKARAAGRDPGTNVALLRLDRPLNPLELKNGEAKAGSLALAFGADGAGGVSARLGLVNVAAAEWTSEAGGRIDRYIALDIRLSRAEEGGLALDASGRRLGFTSFGPRGRVLVIPSATVERVLPVLLRDGRIARGWLGVGLQAVAVPDALLAQAGQPSGAMVMSLVEGGPAAKAGLVPGDIILTVNGAATRSVRRVAAELTAASIGRAAELRVIRGGAVLSLAATIEARPAA
jgi:S1-C subfamily serine protease